MSDAPLFQNTDEQEAAYAPDQPSKEGEIVVIPGAGLGVGTGSPAAGAGTPGTLPPAIAPLPVVEDDDDRARRTDTTELNG
jgi:hypothetical protein